MRRILEYVIAFIALLLFWQLAAVAFNTPALPGPYKVISRPEMLFNAAMGRHFAISLFRVAAGVILGGAAALPLGLILGREKALDRLSAPLVFITYPIPKIVFLPLFMIILGLGNGSKIAIITVIVFFQILVTARDAAKAVPEESVLSIKSLGAGNWQVYRHIVFPSSLPHVFTALRISTGTAIAVLFLAESFATEEGLGYLILNSWSSLNYPQMFAAILALGVMGVLIYEVLEFGEKKMCPWETR